MMSKAQKITCTLIAIAICWLIAYGVGSAAIHCCSAIINICSPSGGRSPLMPTFDAHCQPSPSHHVKQHKSENERAWSTWHDSNDATTCCSATPCEPIGFTAHSVHPQPSSPCLQVAGKALTSGGENNSIVFTHNRQNRYHPTTPIFLLTKSIIC